VISYENRAVFEQNTLSGLHETIELKEGIKKMVKFAFDEENDMNKYVPVKPAPTKGDSTASGDSEKKVTDKKTQDSQKAPSKTNAKKENNFHEAGYDAYITGLCFATLLKFVEN